MFLGYSDFRILNPKVVGAIHFSIFGFIGIFYADSDFPDSHFTRNLTWNLNPMWNPNQTFLALETEQIPFHFIKSESESESQSESGSYFLKFRTKLLPHCKSGKESAPKSESECKIRIQSSSPLIKSDSPPQIRKNKILSHCKFESES